MTVREYLFLADGRLFVLRDGYDVREANASERLDAELALNPILDIHPSDAPTFERYKAVQLPPPAMS